MQTIDLHMHTTISDGTDTPEEIVQKVKAAGIDLFSVTDHDAIKSAYVIPPLLSDGDPVFLPGIEFSCKDALGKYHILGYAYDPRAGAICKITEEGHMLRMKKARARFDYLKEVYGITFPEEEVQAVLTLDNPGKPHIANLMVKYGYAKDRTEVIRGILNEKKFPNENIRPEDAIDSILKSGGIPVLAHPPYGSGEELILGDDLKDRVQRLLSFGLQGLEGFYSGYTQKMQDEVLQLAQRNDLYITAGSDYHGTNKMIPLGDTNLVSLSEAPQGLLSFIRRVGYSY